MIKFLSEEEAQRRLLFADNLKYIMRTKKISIDSVSKKLGVSTAAISKYTKGRTFPDDTRIKELAEALDCTVDDLFDDSYIPWVFGPEGITDKEKYKELL